MGLTPRSGSAPTPRRQREKRAYQFAMVGGTAAAVTVVGTVLAIVGVISGAIPLIAALIAVACLLLFQRTVRSR